MGFSVRIFIVGLLSTCASLLLVATVFLNDLYLEIQGMDQELFVEMSALKQEDPRDRQAFVAFVVLLVMQDNQASQLRLGHKGLLVNREAQGHVVSPVMMEAPGWMVWMVDPEKMPTIALVQIRKWEDYKEY
ncbi:unnamed protein product, partial [Mesorhabditis spiculigera]